MRVLLRLLTHIDAVGVIYKSLRASYTELLFSYHECHSLARVV
jgi:hypothetical protein